MRPRIKAEERPLSSSDFESPVPPPPSPSQVGKLTEVAEPSEGAKVAITKSTSPSGFDDPEGNPISESQGSVDEPPPVGSVAPAAEAEPSPPKQFGPSEAQQAAAIQQETQPKKGPKGFSPKGKRGGKGSKGSESTPEPAETREDDRERSPRGSPTRG